LIECKCGCGAVIKARSRYGKFVQYKKGHMHMGKRGEISTGWKKGRTISSEGYVYVYVPEHPRTSKKFPYVREHIVVMEKHLGRNLTYDDIVHHINGKKDDNRIENLELTTRSIHASKHRSKSYSCCKRP
jgi:hypothetical protein